MDANSADNIIFEDYDEVQSSGIFGAIKGMVSFFTIFRFDIGMAEMKAMDKHLSVVPIIGLIMGLLAVAIVGFAYYVLDLSGAMFTAVLILAVVLGFSKFLHLDGLVDFGDGMIASGSQEKHIRALKDTNIGAGGFGVALIVVLLSIGLYAQLNYMWLLLLIIPVEIMIKNSMVSAAAFGKPSNGMAAAQVRNTGFGSLAVSLILSVVLSLVSLFVLGEFLNAYDDMFASFTYTSYDLLIILGVMALVSTIVGFIMSRIANSNFGFVNGDVLGATNEICRAVVLAAVIVVIGVL